MLQTLYLYVTQAPLQLYAIDTLSMCQMLVIRPLYTDIIICQSCDIDTITLCYNTLTVISDSLACKWMLKLPIFNGPTPNTDQSTIVTKQKLFSYTLSSSANGTTRAQSYNGFIVFNPMACQMSRDLSVIVLFLQFCH